MTDEFGAAILILQSTGEFEPHGRSNHQSQPRVHAPSPHDSIPTWWVPGFIYLSLFFPVASSCRSSLPTPDSRRSQASKEPRLRLEQLALAATGAAAGMTSTAAGEAAADGGAWRFLLAGIAIRQATAHFFFVFLF